MVIVKRCEKKWNPMNCKTLKIGTIDEYRKTENIEIKDADEYTFEIIVNLKDIDISLELLEALQSARGMLSDCGIIKLDIEGRSNKLKDGVRIRHINSYVKWVGRDKPVYCMSKLARLPKPKEIFDSYDDFWFFPEKNLAKFASLLGKEVQDIYRKKLLESNPDYKGRIEQFKCRCTTQDIVYAPRKITLEREHLNDFNSVDFLEKLVHGTIFLKPERFKEEKEIRFAFEFFHKNEQIYPVFNSIIIDYKSLLPYILTKG